MRSFIKSDFLFRFAGGFVLGAVALIGLQPGTVLANLGLAPVATHQLG